MKTLSILLISLFMLGAQAESRAGNGNPDKADTIVINKSQISKKYKVKIFPSASNEVLFFTASGESGKVYQLFVFDMEGKLIKQTQIRNKETTLLTNFTKGSYTFEVFSDDERIENGTMQVR